MGRWAQRKRSGGSKTSAAAQVPLQLVSAVYQGGTVVRVCYNAPVDMGIFTPADFLSENSGNVGASIESSGGPNCFAVVFTGTSGEIGADNAVEYSGNAPGIKTPDNIAR